MPRDPKKYLFDIDLAIPGHRRIIAFRNLLIHGYATVDNRLVWGVVDAKLPELKAAVRHLLD